MHTAAVQHTIFPPAIIITPEMYRAPFSYSVSRSTSWNS
ncbi:MULTISPECIES: hypothetical protein [unclassified Enterobacter]